MKIAFIGTGIMGSRMAHNLLKNNYDLIVCNRTKENAETLIRNGAKWAASPFEAALNADILFTMLSEPQVVKDTAFGKNGFLSGMKKGSLWVDCSTVNPEFSKEMALKANESGIRFIDAPAAGSKQPAEQGELIFFTGGNKNDFEEVKPILEKMGKKILYLGEAGKGTSMKMVVNLLLGAAIASFSEAMILGESLGFDRETILGVLIGASVTAPYLTAKKEKFLMNKYETEFPLKLMYKDLRLIQEAAVHCNINIPVTEVVKKLFFEANQNGYGELDFSALYKFFLEKN